MRGDTPILQSLVKYNSCRHKITEEYRASIQVEVPGLSETADKKFYLEGEKNDMQFCIMILSLKL
jgi:hypothetical protein